MCWVGPTGARHDFKLSRSSIECKATSSVNGLRVEVNGSQQLEPLEGIPLLLIARVYDEHPAGELSVQTVARQILSEVPVDEDLFLERLRGIGVEPSLLWSTETQFRQFKAIGAYEFDVVEEFPRIKGIDTSSRLQDVRYKLDLSDPDSVPGVREFNEFFD